MEATIQVRQRDTLTPPVELRDRYGIRAGDTFRLVDLDGVFAACLPAPGQPLPARDAPPGAVRHGRM